MTDERSNNVRKMKTGIAGFDQIAEGGLPQNRTTLVAGSSGSAKTVLAVQFLIMGVRSAGEAGVFVTFEESVEDIRKNMHNFGWDIEELERDGKFVFIDGSVHPEDENTVIAGSYDLGALLARIENAVAKSGAKRVALDSIGAVISRFSDATTIRNELYRIATALRQMNVTAVMTAERVEEYGAIGRFGIEEFVTDNVIILRNVLEEEKRRRTMEILKFRGAYHQKGEFPFTVVPGAGIVVIPLSALELKQRSSNIRVSSGSKQLDELCGGGFFRDSIILVSGATGTGKTLMVTHFLEGGVSNGERALIFAFEESREQFFRNAIGWGMDFEKLEKEGNLKVVCKYPEVKGLEDHFVDMKKIIEEFKPNRVAVDSLSAMERVSTVRGFREFVIGMTSFIKEKEITGLFTSTTPDLMGGTSITEAHISTITDSIILLRYVELYGEMRRGLTVLKMRGSRHDKDIREFTIDSDGMHIGSPFRNVSGILSGILSHVPMSEVERLDGLFRDGGK